MRQKSCPERRHLEGLFKLTSVFGGHALLSALFLIEHVNFDSQYLEEMVEDVIATESHRVVGAVGICIPNF
jgi:hypothetical protein